MLNPAARRISAAAILLSALALSGCSAPATTSATSSGPDLRFGRVHEDKGRLSMALLEAKEKRSRGQRVWCVPFARDLSGINIYGNAKEWWRRASGIYGRGHQPAPGAVMAFSATRRNPNGHVAVVNRVVSMREVLVDHANWPRPSQISLKMRAVDVSEKNDWSAVRLESTKGALGSIYPVTGFIYKK
ncbi:CHAP domain-containing protein [Paracoccus litorisediminis]|uniref:CHAP domain-containing protein n=1 Tax=Paracoccus litorisediminis TaxID=2006130 RepID=UPI0037333140